MNFWWCGLWKHKWNSLQFLSATNITFCQNQWKFLCILSAIFFSSSSHWTDSQFKHAEKAQKIAWVQKIVLPQDCLPSPKLKHHKHKLLKFDRKSASRQRGHKAAGVEWDLEASEGFQTMKSGPGGLWSDSARHYICQHYSTTLYSCRTEFWSNPKSRANKLINFVW